MQEQTMQLYSFFNSSTSYRARIALALKGLDFDVIPVNLRRGEQRDSAYRERSPAGIVPTLVDTDGFSLTQSLAIIDYLDQRQPEPRLIPLDAAARARVLEIALTIACEIHPVNNMRVLAYLVQELGASDEQKQAWYAHWVAEGLGAVEQLLAASGSNGRFCVGDAPTLADCCLVPQVANALRMKCDLSGFPLVRAVYAHCSGLPAFVAAAPQNQPDYIG